jgi:hypothetical protein
MLMNIRVQDRMAIQELLARYCWLIDHGQGDAWAELWTADGSFTGIPEPLHGRAALRQMPPGFHTAFGGKLRHHIGNVLITPGERPDQAKVRAYSMVSDWRTGGKLLSFASVQFGLIRQGKSWLIQSLHAEILQ